MPAEWYYLLSFLLGTLFVIILIPIVKKIGRASKQVDQPNPRKIHQTPIVRIGGIAIFAAIALTMISLYLGGKIPFLEGEQIQTMITISLGGVIFFLMGLADDIWHLSAFYRLGLQLLATIGLWWQGLKIDLSFLPWDNVLMTDSLSLVITFLWLAGVANAVNWLDGLDGLAAGVVGIIALGILFITLENGNFGVALLMTPLAGSAIAFLWYNFYPATIFMGDSGSNFLGFTLAAGSLVGIANEAGVGNLLIPFLLLGVPIGDMLVVIIARLRQGKSPFHADQIHIHHRILAKGASQTVTALFLYSLTLWSVSIALVFYGLEKPWIYFAPATLLLLGMTWQVKQSGKEQQS